MSFLLKLKETGSLFVSTKKRKLKGANRKMMITVILISLVFLFTVGTLFLIKSSSNWKKTQGKVLSSRLLQQE